MIGGQGGDGTLTVSDLLGRYFRKRGLYVYTSRNVLSRIRGGHADASVRGSRDPVAAVKAQVDLIVAFDQQAIEIGRHELAPHGIILYDSTSFQSETFRTGVGFPFATLVGGASSANRSTRTPPPTAPSPSSSASTRRDPRGDRGPVQASGPESAREEPQGARDRAEGRPRGRGGAPPFLARGRRRARLDPDHRQPGRGPRVRRRRRAVLRRLPDHPRHRDHGVPSNATSRRSTASFARPRTSSPRSTWSSEPRTRGARVMTSTSGPGLSLMTEGIGHAGAAEIPVVVADCQRVGPSTGEPTRHEQSDLSHLANLGHGEFPRFILAPATRGRFEITIEALNLAERWRLPGDPPPRPGAVPEHDDAPVRPRQGVRRPRQAAHRRRRSASSRQYRSTSSRATGAARTLRRELPAYGPRSRATSTTSGATCR